MFIIQALFCDSDEGKKEGQKIIYYLWSAMEENYYWIYYTITCLIKQNKKYDNHKVTDPKVKKKK
jgi:hypothetical protein